MGEGTRSSPPPQPGALLLSASLRAGPPRVARCPRPPSIRWTPVWESRLPLGPERGLGRGEERAGTRRGEERQKGEEKRGVCRGRVGWGRLCQFNPEGVSFIYLFFKKICHESHYTDLPEERRKRVGSEGGRVREVNLKIPLNLKVCKFAWLSVFMSGFFPPHHFHFRPTIMCSRGC